MSDSPLEGGSVFSCNRSDCLFKSGTLTPYIVGGIEACPHEFPYQVHLQYNNSFICGGTIINTFLILTAAHCLLDKRRGYLPIPSRFEVVAGDHDLELTEGTEQHRNVSRILLHEDFNMRSAYDNDIAIIVLETALIFNNHVHSIPLPRRGRIIERFEDNVVVSGWGLTYLRNADYQGPPSEVLNKLTIPIVPNAQCREIYKKSTKAKITDGMMCAGSYRRGSCSGDSGGPATCRSISSNQTVLCGIVSFGIACGYKNYPGVYTDVSHHYDWVEWTIMKLGNSPAKCKTTEFWCSGSKSCIDRNLVCDGKEDCDDGSDELRCLETKSSNLNDTFRCSSGRFVPLTYVCDKDDDCGDNSDESKCSLPDNVKCSSNQFRCFTDKRCIDELWECDNIQDCDDNSDETGLLCNFKGNKCSVTGLLNGTEGHKFDPFSGDLNTTEDCECSDVVFKKSSCARAYLEGGCNICDPPYTELKESRSYFYNQFAHNDYEAILVRQGCTLKVYEEEDFEGNEHTVEDGVWENWNETIGSYKCECKVSSYKSSTKPRRPGNYPVLIDIPGSMENVSSLLLQHELNNHPGLNAAGLSLKSGRSSRNAYVLVLGTTGSGKSSFINLLLENHNATRPTMFSINYEIEELRISVPVNELGIQNSELRLIEVPGLGNTGGVEQDARTLATLDEYLSTHEELKDRLPNVVLIFHKFNDNRMYGGGSNFVRMLNGFNSFLGKITDDKYSNVIFVLTHVCSLPNSIQKNPERRLTAFKSVIEDYTEFPKPIVITVAENKGEEEGLSLVNGYWKLPNGDYYPRNILDKIHDLTSCGGDPIGNYVIRTALRDLEEANIIRKTYPLLNSDHPKSKKYLDEIMTKYFYNLHSHV